MQRPESITDVIECAIEKTYFMAATSSWSGPMRIYNSVPENNCIGCGAPKKQHFGCEYCGRE